MSELGLFQKKIIIAINGIDI